MTIDQESQIHPFYPTTFFNSPCTRLHSGHKGKGTKEELLPSSGKAQAAFSSDGTGEGAEQVWARGTVPAQLRQTAAEQKFISVIPRSGNHKFLLLSCKLYQLSITMMKLNCSNLDESRKIFCG